VTEQRLVKLFGKNTINKKVKTEEELIWESYVIKEQREDVLYHVTYTKNISSIKRKGLNLNNHSNWKKGDAYGEDYGKGYVYAMTSLKDAVNWGFKMYFDKLGTYSPDGRISIIKIKNSGDWEKDNDDITVSRSGDWLKTKREIPAEDVLDSIVVDLELIKSTR
jgi:hypothetical protein